MKYFMSIYSEARGCDRYFEMTAESAEYYYRQYLYKGGDNEEQIQKHFHNGTHVHAPKGFAHGIRIWGEEMSDKELFRLRIKGEIDKEMLED